jgi:hypothetical protein
MLIIANYFLRNLEAACVETHICASFATCIGVSLREGEAESCNKICFDPLSGFVHLVERAC